MAHGLGWLLCRQSCAPAIGADARGHRHPPRPLRARSIPIGDEFSKATKYASAGTTPCRRATRRRSMPRRSRCRSSTRPPGRGLRALGTELLASRRLHAPRGGEREPGVRRGGGNRRGSRRGPRGLYGRPLLPEVEGRPHRVDGLDRDGAPRHLLRRLLTADEAKRISESTAALESCGLSPAQRRGRGAGDRRVGRTVGRAIGCRVRGAESGK